VTDLRLLFSSVSGYCLASVSPLLTVAEGTCSAYLWCATDFHFWKFCVG